MDQIQQDSADINPSSSTSSLHKKGFLAVHNENEPEEVPAEKKPREQLISTDEEISSVYKPTTEACNPTLSDDEDENSETLKGDAIGSTLYSSRFVINTVLKLRDVKALLENDENFEKELETLWDMTVEKDVTLMLLQFDVFDIFLQSMLQNFKDGRLIEILVGIMSNMCSVAVEALEQLCKSEATIDVLLQLLGNDDSGVLIQVMRLYTIAFSKESSAYLWSKRIVESENFVDCFCFILSNSCNTDLLLHSMEALNAILAKSAIMLDRATSGDQQEANGTIDLLHHMLNLKLSESIKQAFLTFHAKETVYTNRGGEEETDEDFNESISESVQKAFIMFLNIQEIIFNYALGDIFNEKTETELKSCLLVIISTISTPIFVLPSNFDYLSNVLEIFKEFFSANSSLHDENVACYVANVWEILRKLKIKQVASGASNGFDDDEVLDDDGNESLNKLFKLTHAVLKIMLQKYDTETLEIILRRLSPIDAFKLLEAYGVALSSDYIEELHITTFHCEQLKSVLSE